MSALKRSGGIFDYDQRSERLTEVERELEQPSVWDDPERAQTWGFSPPTGNLYIGAKLDEHGAEQMKVHFFADKDESLLDKMPGSACTAMVDMDERKLMFSINGNEFIDSGVELPAEGVRPWCFLYHEGDSITLTEVDAAGFGTGGASRPSTAGTESGIA